MVSVLDAEGKHEALAAAAGSPTPDWAAKVEWLEACDCPRGLGAGVEATRSADAAARLAWLQARGYPLGAVTVGAAAEAGSAPALQYPLMEAAVVVDAQSGCGEALEWLAAEGCPLDDQGEAYGKACTDRDLGLARLLRRLGVSCKAPFYMQRWLLQKDFPLGHLQMRRKLPEDALGAA
ncbi:hypothetical protein GPECTOR_401g234 [Gonium pectorale]|uniref:Uncharacterized protein n=1 Tax=Gonium pectorale TaxID=33097 RepID=A0A150FVC2_GONPE|nr:hypothetical protein GPECTOR_401g234 [Gonium pectorale]|eukprot:KXZ41547.1 hypothetical protein GPECTOR_401g234 [Gonium pectorale]